MGPTQEALALADFLIAKYSLRVDRYTLAYAIMEHEEAAIRAEQEAAPSAPAEGGDLAIAQRLAVSLWQQHYSEEAPNWKVDDTLTGVLLQISNMTSGMKTSPEPLAQGEDAGKAPWSEAEREEEDYHVITTMGRLLAEIAVILKGPEPAGTAWSYHDLPALVASEVAEPRQVAAEMKAWAHTKMADQQSSRRDRMMVAEWAKRLLPESSFPVKDFDVEGMSITKEAAREAVKRVALEQALTQQRGECEASVSVKQKWPARHAFPKPDEHGNETGSIGEHAYAEGWNACLDEAKRMSGVPMPLKGKKGVVVAECTTPQPSADAVRELQAEIDRLNAIVNTPQSNDFLRAVSTEAEHQRQRWGSDHDAGKAPADWFWLVGYLAGKALHAHATGDVAKAEHHIITTAAALANWHLAAFGKTDMRPGIDGESLLGRGG